MPEGMKITLSGIGGGLTRDKAGKMLLPVPFVFQCPPLEEYKVTHAFSMGTYDTIEEGQFVRRGSRQLATWQFDTLVMGIAVNEPGTRQSPGWAAFPKFDRPGVPTALQWYVEQLVALHDAGSPFHFTAQFQSAPGAFDEAYYALGPVTSMHALLLGFSQAHKHGEADAVYLEGVSFQEWRDPTITQRGLGGPPATDKPPTSCTLRQDGRVLTEKHELIPKQKRHATLHDLSKFFYHHPAGWRNIATANNLHGGGANIGLVKFAKYHKIPRNGVKIKIPALPKGH